MRGTPLASIIAGIIIGGTPPLGFPPPTGWSSSSDESSLVRGMTDFGADLPPPLPPRGLSPPPPPSVGVATAVAAAASGWAESGVAAEEVGVVVLERPAEEPSFMDFMAGRRLTWR